MSVFEVSCRGRVTDAHDWSNVCDRFDALLGIAGDEFARHRFVVLATDESEALHILGEALSPFGLFDEFDVSEIRRDGRPEYVPIDWQLTELQTLTEVERRLIAALLEEEKPTWILASDPELPADHDVLIAHLRGLVARNLLATPVHRGSVPGITFDVGPSLLWWRLTPAARILIQHST